MDRLKRLTIDIQLVRQIKRQIEKRTSSQSQNQAQLDGL